MKIKKIIDKYKKIILNNNIIRNMGFLTLGELTAKTLNFFIIIFIVRALSVDAYGRYAIAFNFVMSFVFLIDLGMNTIVIRDCSRNSDEVNTIINKVLVIKIILSIITIILISAIAIFFMPYDWSLKLIISLASLIVVLKEILNFGNTIFRSSENMMYISILRIIEVMIYGILICVFLLIEKNEYSLVFAWIITYLIELIIQIIISRKYVKYSIKLPDFKFFKKIFSQSIWIGVASFLGRMYSSVNIIIISLIVGTTEVAFYTAALQIVSAGTLIRMSISDAIFPTTCKEIRKKGYAQKFYKYIIFASIFTAIGALIITLFAKNIILLIFGNKYYYSTIILQILIWYIPLYVFNIWSCQVLDSTNNQKFHVINEIVILLITIILNYFLTLQYGAIGAAISAVSARLVGVILLNKFARNIIKNIDKKG